MGYVSSQEGHLLLPSFKTEKDVGNTMILSIIALGLRQRFPCRKNGGKNSKKRPPYHNEMGSILKLRGGPLHSHNSHEPMFEGFLKSRQLDGRQMTSRILTGVYNLLPPIKCLMTLELYN